MTYQLTPDESQEIANVLAYAIHADLCGCGRRHRVHGRTYAELGHAGAAALAPVVAEMIAAHRVEAVAMADLADWEGRP